MPAAVYLYVPMPEASFPPLIVALCDPATYDPPVEGVRMVETHISWVFLTGTQAYKIKKPVDFGFLDFSTLEKRRFFCEEELRLNRRLAPDIYLSVLPITGQPSHPNLGGSGRAFEYTVKMRQFDEAALGDRLARNGKLMPEHVDRLAEALAAFHGQAARSTATDSHGLPETIQKAAEDNFSHIHASSETSDERDQLDELFVWTGKEYERLRERLWARKRAGFVRECHGDLHLGNLVLIGERLIPFDCIEFSENLRWIDVISEIAFLAMDLEVKGYKPLAFRLLNRYLEITGDYAGLDLLDYYRVYRALVRAKIARLTQAQSRKEDERKALAAQYRSYVDYAEKASRLRRPILLITHGFSGSGKSHLAALIAEGLPAVHLRSDIERKRLTGFGSYEATRSEPGQGIYTEEMTRLTYDRLLDTAKRLLSAGWSVIVDATFLELRYRRAQRALAKEAGAGFLILDAQAPIDLLRRRIQARLERGADPSEANIAVLERQLEHDHPFEEAERPFALAVDTGNPPETETILDEITRRCSGRENKAG